LRIGRDPDLAAVDVQNRVNQALGRMPQEVRTNGISVTKNSVGFIGALGFYSDDDRYDSLFISNYLDLYARDAFKRVPACGNVIIFGERKFAMRLWLDPSRMAGEASRPATWSTRCASRTSRSRPAASATHRRPTIRCSKSACERPGDSRRPRTSRTSS
jgi:HAE1 family hydrophobic/amphiphilic exporter-1